MARTGTPEKKTAKKIVRNPVLAKAQEGGKLVTQMLNAFMRGQEEGARGYEPPRWLKACGTLRTTRKTRGCVLRPSKR
jgi:hypothetical protein